MDPGLSGYPHEYGNIEGLNFPKACRIFDQQANLMEFPVYDDGKPYPYQSKKKDITRDTPYRIVYKVNKYPKRIEVLCGLMAHIVGDERKFKLCTLPGLMDLAHDDCEDGGQVRIHLFSKPNAVI